MWPDMRGKPGTMLANRGNKLTFGSGQLSRLALRPLFGRHLAGDRMFFGTSRVFRQHGNFAVKMRYRPFMENISSLKLLNNRSPPRAHLESTSTAPGLNLDTTSTPPRHYLCSMSAPPRLRLHLDSTSAPPGLHLGSTSTPTRS